MRQQFFEGKSWYSLLLLPFVHKDFRYQKFSETPKGTLWTSVLRGKKIDENRDAPLSLLSSTFLVTRNTSLGLRRLSVVWDKVFLTENRNTPSSYAWIFSIPETFSNTGVPLENGSVLWDKTISREDCETRDPLIFLTFFVKWNFLKQKGSPTKFFGTLRRKIFDENPWYYLPPSSTLINKTLWYLKFSETQGFPYEVFLYWERRKNWPKIAMPLLSL